ncbi:IPT/TIG domain-containing protein [Tieghemostelium lacteum]|uniref:IPT/TIG domain-containing protein n=1 Tax=Tieghemostelium lacteum TaxID=361077 RepID=A0A152A2Q6_TIELA|nr:IPT/TIG domain-containing protein [Tieghemostelium lacteum]|eukprot:KYR00490.1 IPT/TIG domain-containing protein [Tieghemostelium lacteum]
MHKHSNFTITIVLLFINLCLVRSQTFSQYFNWTVNNHVYVRVDETAIISNTDAQIKCSQLTVGSNNGYLVTITSPEEWEFLKTNSLASIIGSAWISGSDLDKLGSWVYNTGPETGMPLYNLYFDKCYQFCTFASVEPNLIPNEHWLQTAGDPMYWNNNNNNAIVQSYICEFGGLNQPIIDSLQTVGGQVTIKNIVGYDLASLTVTWTSVSDSTTFQCQSKTIVDSTTITCQIPSNTGKYTVRFLDVYSKTDKVNWAFNLPFISSVYPKFNSGELITITGTGFGTIASKLSVLIGTTQIPCNNPSIIRPDEAITCSLSASLGTSKFLPVTVNSNGLIFSSFKAAFYYPSTSLFYNGFISSSSWQVSKDNYADALKLDGYTGAMAFIKDAAFYDLIYKTLPEPLNGAMWNIWQPYYYNGSQYILLDGPNTGSAVVPYSSNTINLANVNINHRFAFNLSNSFIEMLDPSTARSTIAQYGGISPKFVGVARHSVPTDGSSVSLQIDNYGTVFSTITVNLYLSSSTLQLPYTRDYINSLLIVDIPAGYNGPYSITVTVDTFTTSNAQYIDYESPTITNIPPISTSGGSIVITGTNYFNTLSLVSVQGLSCSNLAIQTAHTVLTCTIPSGSGKTSTTVTVGSKVSSPFTFQYSNPTVSSVSNISPLGGIITINGGNFFTDSSKISISLGTFGSCTGIKVETAHSILSCTAPAGYAKQPVIVTVNTLVSNSDIYLNYNSPTITSVTQVDDYLNIVGTNFGNSLNGLTITLGSIDITSNCLSGSTNTAFSCKNLPTTVQSGTLSISGSNSVPTQTVNLVPYLSSLGQTSIPTSGSTVSINGRFFESNIIVKIGTTTSTFTKTNNQLLMLTIPSGTGTGKIVTVSNNNGALQSVGSLTFSYSAPTISTAAQTLNTLLISGQNFGNDLSKISVNIGTTSIPSNQITLTTSHTQITITLADNLQNAALTVTVDYQPATLNTFKLKPILTSGTSPSVDGGKFVISGNFLSQTNQAGQSTNVQFKFNNIGSTCTFLSGPSPYKYECTIGSGFGQINSIATVDGIDSDSFRFYYASPIITSVQQVDDFIELFGNEFGIDFNGLTVSIGPISLSGCTSNNTFGQCKNLPLTVQSGNVTLSGENTDPEPIELIFKPFLKSINPTIVDTKGQEITITGRFFEQSTLGSPNSLSILDSGISQNILTLVSNSEVLYTTQPNTGKDHNIQLQISNRTSNILKFDNEKPIINSIFQDQDTLVINGEYFGTSNQVVSTSINKTPISIQDYKVVIPLSPSDMNNNLTVTVSDQESNSNSFYLTPLIELLSPVGVEGGITTISGKYLSDIDANSNPIGLVYTFTKISNIMTIQEALNTTITCQYKSNIQKTICTIPASTGEFEIYSQYSTYKSNVFKTSFIAPGIQLATPTKKGTPGKVTITGSNFGNLGLYITIRNSTAFSECTNAIAISSTMITCYFASDINTEISNGFTQPLTVNVSVDILIGLGDVFNYQLIKECPSNCVSPFGSCIDGTCICSNEYTGTDCQTKKDDLPEQPSEKPTDNNGTTNVPGNNFQFQIAVTHLRELNSIDGSTVKTLKTSDLVWGQPVVNGDKKYYKGTFTSDPAIVELFVTYFKTSQTIQFAGETMQMADNSIKYEIHVSKWNFTKSINSLQVIYQSTTPKSVEYECETKETTTSFDTSSDSLGWFQVSNGGTTMMAKFSNKMLVDNRILNSQVKLLDQNDELYKENTDSSSLELFVSMNTPTFRDKIILDPNFSSLLETTEEIKTDCSKSTAWKIPVIVVLCCVGSVALIIAGIYGYKKYKQRKLEIKLSELRNRIK